jgi:1,4-alpha-glucan branching enzyme
MGAVVADDIPAHGQPWSAEVILPPLAVVWFAPAGDIS